MLVFSVFLYRGAVKLYSRAQSALRDTFAQPADPPPLIHETPSLPPLLREARLETVEVGPGTEASGKMIAELRLRTRDRSERRGHRAARHEHRQFGTGRRIGQRRSDSPYRQRRPAERGQRTSNGVEGRLVRLRLRKPARNARAGVRARSYRRNDNADILRSPDRSMRWARRNRPGFDQSKGRTQCARCAVFKCWIALQMDSHRRCAVRIERDTRQFSRTKIFRAALQAPSELLVSAEISLSCRAWLNSKLHVVATPGSSSTVITTGSGSSKGRAICSSWLVAESGLLVTILGDAGRRHGPASAKASRDHKVGVRKPVAQRADCWR